MNAMATGFGLIPLLRCNESVGTKRGGLETSKDCKATNDRSNGRVGTDNARNEGSRGTDDNDYLGLNDDSLIRITTSSASPVVVIGRYQLLNSFRAACSQHDCDDESDDDDDERRRHREALRWGTKAISREMLRFSDAGMQVRSKHCAVYNGMAATISSSSPHNCCGGTTNENNDAPEQQSLEKEQQEGNKWSTKLVEVKPGTTLTFGPTVERRLLGFRVVTLDHERRTEQDSNSAAKGSIECEPKGDSTHLCVIDLTEDSERSNKPNSPTKENTVDREKPPFLVHLFPFGNGFSASRRQKLEQNLKLLGATIVDDLCQANYIVISESVRSMATVATRMRIKEEQLVQHFRDNPHVRCILPSWVDYCIASAKSLVVPSRIHYWCHSPASPNVATKKISNKRKINGSDDFNEGEKNTARQKRTNATDDDAIQTRKKCFTRNVRVAEAFKTLADLHQSMYLIPADTWKSYCFRIVAGRILELDFEVSDDENTQQKLRSIKGFGKSVCEKIQQCIDTGTISRIQEFQSDPQRQAMKNLTDIWGVGIVRASDLMDRGYRTIDDVRQGIGQRRLVLERNQLVGVDCYEDILDEMSRSEVEAIGEKVRLVAERLFPGIEFSIMGSYRRGKKSCGDVDIQLTHPDFVRKIPTDALSRIIDMLWTEGDIAMHLTFLNGMTTGLHFTDYQKASRNVPRHAWEKAKHPSKQTEYKFYMGCFNSPIHPNRRRRVDIKFYPYRERAFATLYFTGNGYFNRSMRLWATRVFGFKLNDQGLFSCGDGKTRVFEASTEREIFDRLKLVYREPHERQYWDALEPIDEAVKPDLRMTEAQLNHDKKSNQWVK